MWRRARWPCLSFVDSWAICRLADHGPAWRDRCRYVHQEVEGSNTLGDTAPRVHQRSVALSRKDHQEGVQHQQEFGWGSLPAAEPYAHYPLIVSGEGHYLWDDQGKRYNDGASGGVGCVLIGHAVQEVLEAMAKRAQTPCHAHISAFNTPPPIRLAESDICHGRMAGSGPTSALGRGRPGSQRP